MDTKPMLLGFYKADPYVPTLVHTATVAVLQVWCRREGYLLDVPYREQNGNGALDTMITRLATNDDVAGVIVPSLDHLGPTIEDRVSRITATGKRLFVAYPSEARR
jgi:hypothetical protein